MEEKNYDTSNLKHQFNDENKAKEVREYNAVADLNNTIENKNKNLGMSIFLGILSWVFMAIAIVIVVNHIRMEGFWEKWIFGGMVVGALMLPAGICMLFQYIKLIPLLKLKAWKDAGTYDYQFTKGDKAAFIFALVTYFVFIIVKALLKIFILVSE